VEKGKSLHLIPVIFPGQANIYLEQDTSGLDVPVEVSGDWKLAK